MAICYFNNYTTKTVPVKVHSSIQLVESYYAVLQKIYKIIVVDLQECGVSKKMVL